MSLGIPREPARPARDINFMLPLIGRWHVCGRVDISLHFLRLEFCRWPVQLQLHAFLNLHCCYKPCLCMLGFASGLLVLTCSYSPVPDSLFRDVPVCAPLPTAVL